MTESTKTKAYIDGFLYIKDEQPCSICGKLTNRVNILTGNRECTECGDLVVGDKEDCIENMNLDR